MVFVLLIVIGGIAFLWSVFGLEETLVLQKKPQYNWKKIAKSIFTDKGFWIYGGLIGVINGIIFSYYSEAPFIFIDHFKFSIVEYGCIGFVVALACFFGSRYCKKLSGIKSNNRILFVGNFTFFFGISIFLFAALFLNLNYLVMIFTILAAIFIMFFGISCMLPICLSNALLNHKSHLGISGAVLGLYYYALVGCITWLMSYFHTSSIIVLPLFLLFWFIVNTILIVLNRK